MIFDNLIEYFRENREEWSKFKTNVDDKFVTENLTINDINEMIENTNKNKFGDYLYLDEGIRILLKRSLGGDCKAQYYLYDKLIIRARTKHNEDRINNHILLALIFLIISGTKGDYSISKKELNNVFGENKMNELLNRKNFPNNADDILNFIVNNKICI